MDGNIKIFKIFKMTFEEKLQKNTIRLTQSVGSVWSLLIHTALFIVSFLLYFIGFNLTNILLVLTTLVSLEAIYLSIFIQMSVNFQSKKLHTVALGVEDIQEDVEDIQKDVGVIQKDVEEIQEDVEEIQEDQEDEDNDEDEDLKEIKETIQKLLKEVIELKRKK